MRRLLPLIAAIGLLAACTAAAAAPAGQHGKPTTTTTTTATTTTTTATTTTVPTTTTVGTASTPYSGAVAGPLVFRDEFDGTAVDAAKWGTCYPWGDCVNLGNSGDFLEAQCYTPNNLTVANGVLDIEARAEAATCAGLAKEYTSGLLQTHGHFDQTYGYFEMRAKLPTGVSGMWPAFWTIPSDLTWPPEIDQLENFGNPINGGKVTHTYHRADQSTTATDYFLPGGACFCTDFHVFGLEWRADHISWWVDGTLTKTTTTAITSTQMYLLLNLAVRAKYATPTVLPAHMAVDYVRAWQ